MENSSNRQLENSAASVTPRHTDRFTGKLRGVGCSRQIDQKSHIIYHIQRCPSPVLVQTKSRFWIFLCPDFCLVPDSSLDRVWTKFRFSLNIVYLKNLKIKFGKLEKIKKFEKFGKILKLVKN